MFKSARSRLRAAVFACAAALGLGAYAATPIAVWDGNFSESATINGATFNANGNTVAEDGSYVKITGEKGAVFTLNKSYRYITAVFTVSNLNETAAYDRALATVGGDKLFGAYLQSGTRTTHGINGNAIWPTANASDYSSYDATLTSYADAETQRTFSLTQVHSTYSYNGTHLYEVYGGNTAAAIKFGGSGNNGLRAGQAYSKVVIGGMESYTEGTLFKAASDLVILKVALYASDSTFPIAQADYATYSMPSMTVVETPSTMSELNTAVAASSDAVALSDVSATITLDEEPSDATKSILQSAYWQGTVLIKDADKTNIVPSNYGNPNSTLKLSGVKGYFAAQQFNSSATPAIELEDSETDGREYGLWQNNGYSFYSGASATYQYMNTPELKGSGTYKIDTTETSSLFVADKFSNFTGKLEVTYGAVWLGVAVPSRNAAGRELVKVGTVRVSEAFVNAPLSQWTGWTVANGYLGDITVAAGSTNNYTDNRVNFLNADSWKGTVTISTATNNTNGHVEIWLSKLGGANSTIVINDLVSGGKDYYLNEGSYQNNPTFVSTIDINGDVQFKNGSSDQTVTFDKVTSDSATDKLTFAFPTSATLNFKINSLDNFAGTISASSSTPLTISNITSTAALGTALVKVDATNKNIASLDATELNGTSTNLCVDTVNDVSGIYIAAAIIGSTGYATVQNAIDALGNDPAAAQLATISVVDANATIPDGYKVENGVISKDAVQYAALVSDGTTHLRVSDALTYVYMLMPTNLTVTVTDATWEDNGTYDDYFVWDSNVRTYTPKEMAVRIGVYCYPTLASAVAEATDGQTVTLLADVTLDATVVVTNSLTLNLNGFDIAATDARALWIKAGTVSITGEGEISANATENSSFPDSSSVIRVGDSAVNANAASLALGADVTVSSGHCYGITTFGKNTPGISLVVNGTVAVTGTASAISGNGSSGLASANITVNDGAVISATADAGIYFPGTGTLSIAGGTITGPTAVYVKCGTVNVTGGTLTGTAAKAAYAYNGDGLNATGDALVIDTCGYPGNPATVSVTGGTFTSQNAEAVASYKKGDDAKYADDTVNEAATGFVSGGTFNTAVADTYCANGYEPTDNGNGTYGVRVDLGWIYEAADYPNYTGSWSNDVVYSEGKAHIEDGNTYTANRPSDGRMVTVAMTLSFDDVNDEDETVGDAKAAVK
nr:carbohydrate-binding domain-containing protein [Kiritimatiellia bacterium]